MFFSIANLIRFCLSMFFLFSLTMLSISQDDEPPAPEFLYRDNDKLILVNGYTGEATELPINVREQDRLEWTPDGAYLLVKTPDEYYLYCINLYDVDIQEWVYQEPISCDVQETDFTPDGKTLLYTTFDQLNGVLWQHNVEENQSEMIYQTSNDNNQFPHGVSSIVWSPSGTYLTFEFNQWIMGGTLNSLVVMNYNTREYVTLSAPDTYYAYYHPIWSEDERWFLIDLQEEYVTSGSLPLTNHRGDVYLFNTVTGEEYRITYSPTAYKTDVRWTDNGEIAFTEIVERDVKLTIEEAMSIEPVPREDIVTPERYDEEEFLESIYRGDFISPDPYVAAWISPYADSVEGMTTLNIGNVFSQSFTIEYTTLIPDDYGVKGIIIGWRPNDYPYPLG